MCRIVAVVHSPDALRPLPWTHIPRRLGRSVDRLLGDPGVTVEAVQTIVSRRGSQDADHSPSGIDQVRPGVSGMASVRLGSAKRQATKAGNHGSRAGRADPKAALAPPTVDACASDPSTTRSYVIFKCRFAQDLYCAVSTSGPIADFLLGAGWVFQGTLGKRGFRQPGFKPASAHADARRDGFHLFFSPRRRN